jgi:hypothetical protein
MGTKRNVIINAPRHVRICVFQMKQIDYAEMLGLEQAAVSFWETQGRFGSFESMVKVRTEALKRGISWNDLWFFEVPPDAPKEIRLSRLA